MNNPNSKPDDLTKTMNKADVELTEEELKKTSGGAGNVKFNEFQISKPTDKTSPGF